MQRVVRFGETVLDAAAADVAANRKPLLYSTAHIRDHYHYVLRFFSRLPVSSSSSSSSFGSAFVPDGTARIASVPPVPSFAPLLPAVFATLELMRRRSVSVNWTTFHALFRALLLQMEFEVQRDASMGRPVYRTQLGRTAAPAADPPTQQQQQLDPSEPEQSGSSFHSRGEVFGCSSSKSSGGGGGGSFDRQCQALYLAMMDYNASLQMASVENPAHAKAAAELRKVGKIKQDGSHHLLFMSFRTALEACKYSSSLAFPLRVWSDFVLPAGGDGDDAAAAAAAGADADADADVGEDEDGTAAAADAVAQASAAQQRPSQRRHRWRLVQAIGNAAHALTMLELFAKHERLHVAMHWLCDMGWGKTTAEEHAVHTSARRSDDDQPQQQQQGPTADIDDDNPAPSELQLARSRMAVVLRTPEVVHAVLQLIALLGAPLDARNAHGILDAWQQQKQQHTGSADAAASAAATANSDDAAYRATRALVRSIANHHAEMATAHAHLLQAQAHSRATRLNL
jgi:hypothetical protein